MVSRDLLHGERMRPATMDRQGATDCGGWRAGHNGGDATALLANIVHRWPALSRGWCDPIEDRVSRLGLVQHQATLPLLLLIGVTPYWRSCSSRLAKI